MGPVTAELDTFWGHLLPTQGLVPLAALGLPARVNPLLIIVLCLFVLSFTCVGVLSACLCFMCAGVLTACLCTTCMTGTCRGQKRASGPLELESQTFVSLHVNARNQTRPAGRTTSTLTH